MNLSTDSSTLNTHPKKDPPMWRFAILIILLCLATILKLKSTLFPKQVHPSAQNSPPPISTTETNILDAINRHLLIHSSSTPTIVHIEHPEENRKQNFVFFKDVEVGDTLVLWPHQAVLYSPSKDKILSVWPE